MASNDRDSAARTEQDAPGSGERAAPGTAGPAPGQRTASPQAADELAPLERPSSSPQDPGNGEDAGASHPYGLPEDSGPPNPYGPIRYDPVGRYGTPGEYEDDNPYGTLGAVGRYGPAGQNPSPGVP